MIFFATVMIAMHLRKVIAKEVIIKRVQRMIILIKVLRNLVRIQAGEIA